MKDKRLSAVDMLYEEPGPKAKRATAIATTISLILVALLLFYVIRLFYVNGQLQPKFWSFFTKWTTWRFLGKGLIGTIEAALAAGVLTFCIGFLFMVGRICPYRVIRAVATVLVEFTRGVPTLLFIYFFFLVIPQAGIKLNTFWRIALPVAISASGVVAEVLRSGVNAVPAGQKEAALSLGMRPSHVFLKVVFPQAIRYVIPALISELVIVVKDTTFAYVVNFPDLMQNAKVLVSNYDSMLPVYLVVAVIYILINYTLNQISAAAGRRRVRAGAPKVQNTQTV
ncbi:MAG: amino acid ABC transporter permease [Eubacteriales bacterium]|nr:amino acid ABC transporter permease [Eubacteriales bacterium]